jgi:hypothetical protein
MGADDADFFFPKRNRRDPRLDLRDIATNSFGGGDSHGPIGENGVKGVPEIMCGCLRTFTTEIGETVINSALVDQAAICGEDGCRGNDLRPAESHQRMVWVQHDWQIETVLMIMLPDTVEGFLGITVHEPESNTAWSIGLVQLADIRSVPVGDWAIIADKNKDPRHQVARRQRGIGRPFMEQVSGRARRSAVDDH